MHDVDVLPQLLEGVPFDVVANEPRVRASAEESLNIAVVLVHEAYKPIVRVAFHEFGVVHKKPSVHGSPERIPFLKRREDLIRIPFVQDEDCIRVLAIQLFVVDNLRPVTVLLRDANIHLRDAVVFSEAF